MVDAPTVRLPESGPLTIILNQKDDVFKAVGFQIAGTLHRNLQLGPLEVDIKKTIPITSGFGTPPQSTSNPLRKA
jgi:hypothetical protein